MDLQPHGEYVEFRDDCRRFLDRHWRPTRDPATANAFRRRATEAGYLHRGIPRRYGGSEQPADVLRAHIIHEEFARAGAPRELGTPGVTMLVPTLLECGAPWQCERFIERTLFGEINWAQGYSEPGAGSDLAALATRANLVDDRWVINGQKIWSSLADQADFIFLLARTEPGSERHAGISYLLLDMKQPGVTVRPIRQINDASSFCEIFFDNAETPHDWIVGRPGDGWAVSKSTLRHERNSVGSGAASRALFEQLLKLARKVTIDGRPALQDPLLRERLARLEGHVQAHALSGLYQLTRDAHGEPPGLLSQMNKLIHTNIAHEVAAIATDLIDADGLLMPGSKRESNGSGNQRWVNQILSSLALAMGSGTSNIQRNVIAERGLGLPKS